MGPLGEERLLLVQKVYNMVSRIRRLMTMALLPFVLFPLPAAADEPALDAAAISAKVDAASPKATTYRETTETVTSNGSKTVTVTIRRGQDWRTVYGRGPFQEEQGVAGGQGWHQNANGQTVLEQPEAGEAKADPTTSRVARISTPVDGYVVSELNLRGWGERRYVDATTWHVVRTEQVSANGTSTTNYDDFRDDLGRVFAHHWATDNRYAQTTSDTRVIAYDTSPVSDSEVAVPETRRLLVEFPEGMHSVDLPAQFGTDLGFSHVYVRVMINGRGLDFVLDSGADSITIDNGTAHELGLELYGKRLAAAAGRFTTGRALVPEMRIGPLTMHNVAVDIVPDGDNEVPGVRTVGLLGFDFLAELGVTIDYEHQKVTAVPGRDYVPPVGPNVIPLDVRLGDDVPSVDVAINGALSEDFIVDTGGAGGLMIFDAFARKHPEALKDDGGGGIMRQMSFGGIGGAFETKPYQLRSARVGPLNFVDFVSYLVTTREAYDWGDDGIIGTEFLRLFNVGLDYGDSRIYLVPNKDGRRAMNIKG